MKTNKSPLKEVPIYLGLTNNCSLNFNEEVTIFTEVPYKN